MLLLSPYIFSAKAIRKNNENVCFLGETKWNLLWNSTEMSFSINLSTNLFVIWHGEDIQFLSAPNFEGSIKNLYNV